MSVDSSANINGYLSKKWSNLRRILENSGPFCRPDFEPSAENLKMIMNDCKILVIGNFL